MHVPGRRPRFRAASDADAAASVYLVADVREATLLRPLRALHGWAPAEARGTDAWLVLGALALVVALNVAVAGDGGWAFRDAVVRPHGPLAFLVRAAHGAWRPDLPRSVDALAGLALVPLALVAAVVRRRPRWLLVTACALVLAALLVPPVALQTGLRQSTAPWFYVNDSTYQTELAGALVARGSTPYGHDYSRSGLDRFYSLDGTTGPAERSHLALRHFPYPPGAALVAAGWRLLPHPFDDLRWLVLLASLGLFGACLAFPGPLDLRLALGVAAAGNPMVVHAAWFGNTDALALFPLVLAFALAARGRASGSAVALAAAVLLKQFAVVAVPFVAVLLVRRCPRAGRRNAALSFAGLVAAAFAPFLAADAGAVWRDVVLYGGQTYPILGYGLANILAHAHLIGRRSGSYPFFWLAALVWLPATAVLARAARRSPAPWLAGAGFAVSISLLLFLARVFQASYAVYPLTAAVLTALLALAPTGPWSGSPRSSR